MFFFVLLFLFIHISSVIVAALATHMWPVSICESLTTRMQSSSQFQNSLKILKQTETGKFSDFRFKKSKGWKFSFLPRLTVPGNPDNYSHIQRYALVRMYVLIDFLLLYTANSKTSIEREYSHSRIHCWLWLPVWKKGSLSFIGRKDLVLLYSTYESKKKKVKEKQSKNKLK